MKLEFKVYGALCEPDIFNINGIEARHEDFGTKEDRDRENAEPYCCANMKFEPKPCTDKVLEKYSISVGEYNEVCEALDALSFGNCGWCA